MKTKIAKEFKWEMGHRLPFHDGPCKNLHGHTYRMRIEIEGELMDNGMVLDYYDLKQMVLPIIDELDHSFVVDSTDQVMIDFLESNEMKHKIIDYFSTAENLTTFMIDQIVPKLKEHKNISTLTLRLNETEDVYSERRVEL
jgi:6-pyruvoyltetrahydropterin/6-carboxytetrahydropterin synthase